MTIQIANGPVTEQGSWSRSINLNSIINLLIYKMKHIGT